MSKQINKKIQKNIKRESAHQDLSFKPIIMTFSSNFWPRGSYIIPSTVSTAP